MPNIANTYQYCGVIIIRLLNCLHNNNKTNPTNNEHTTVILNAVARYCFTLDASLLYSAIYFVMPELIPPGCQ